MENLKTKSVLIYDYGTFTSLAERLGKDFGKVYYYSPWKSSYPKIAPSLIGEGLSNVERVNNLFDYIDEVDVFVFPDIIDADLQLHLESLGKKVFGSRRGEELETNRAGMREYMKELKLPVGHYEIIKGVDALRLYLKDHKNVWVKIDTFRGDFETFQSKNYEYISTRIDVLEREFGILKNEVEFMVEDSLENKVEIGYDGYCIDGKFPNSTVFGLEIKSLGYVGVFKDYKELPETVIDFNNKISEALKGYNYRNFWSTEIRVGSDKKGYMIDACFDDQTEVLTNKGWKFFKDLDKTETIATLNSKGFLEFQSPTDYIVNEYDGKMIHLSNRKGSFDCMVTPNHLVLRTDRNKNGLYKERADSLKDKGYIPRTAKWKGSEDFFTLPAYHNEWDFIGQYGDLICTKTKDVEEIKIPMGDWCEFMGWYLSEGSLGSKHVVQISQKKYVDQIEDVLKKLPFEYTFKNDCFRICSVQLAAYLHKYGLCSDKYIPDYIKNTKPEYIRLFLDAFNLGDGSIHKGNKIYFSTSNDLIDGIQELLLRVGSLGNITKQNKKGTICKIKEKEYVRNHDIYVLTENNQHLNYWFETGARKSLYINEVDYKGIVYCATVPNGTLYVRRNGKATWSSNCSRLGSPPNELYQEMFTNISQIIWEGAHGRCIDPIPQNKFGVEIELGSSFAEKNWLPIQFPEKFAGNIKLRNYMKYDNEYYIIPQTSQTSCVGAIVATGKTMDEALDQIEEISESIKGFYLEIPADCIEAAKGEIEKLKSFGYDMFK